MDYKRIRTCQPQKMAASSAALVAGLLLFNSPCTFAAKRHSHSNVSALQQVTTTVRGTVVDENGKPIIGASVMEKGTTNGTITDFNGKFTLKVSSLNAQVQVNYIGYKPITIKASLIGKSVISLKEDAEILNEVVVVGYGTQKKATLTGAVSMVSGDVLESRPVSNTVIGLQGQIPGLTITRTSARPGNEDMSIQLRGVSSINSVDPLIIIDGVPAISNTEFSSLNPNDIETISVLKDASAAIYGSRAAGGVILVTTKKGKERRED